MKLDKLSKKLSRDLAANPKKAAILGLMVLVALYFWMPLLTAWLPGGGSTSTAQAANVILTDDPEEGSGTARKPKETLKWEKVRQCVDSDPWMAAANYDPQWRNPFALPVPPPVEESTEAAAEAAAAAAALSVPAAEVDPTDAGLSVASVAVGPRVRAVTIGGEVYRENDLVEATAQDGETLEFRIVSIAPTEVQFERNGKVYRLQLSRPRLAKGDRIDRGGATDN